ncbi:hypothetical protein D3C73_1172420 [compost metagenome]
MLQQSPKRGTIGRERPYLHQGEFFLLMIVIQTAILQKLDIQLREGEHCSVIKEIILTKLRHQFTQIQRVTRKQFLDRCH